MNKLIASQNNGIYTTEPFKVLISRALKKRWQIKDKRFKKVKNCLEPKFLAKSLTSIFQTSPIQSAKNLLLSMDRTKDIKVGKRTSFTIRLTKNLTALVDKAEDADVGNGGSGCNKSNNKKVKKSPFKKLSRFIG